MSEETAVRGFRFSYAELEALNGDKPEWARVRALLGFEVPKDAGVVQGCGLTSLFAREWAEIQNGNVAVADSVLDAADRLCHADRWVDVGVFGPGQAAPTAYGADAQGGHRFYAAAVAPGVLEVLPFTDVLTPAEQLETIIVQDFTADQVAVSIKLENVAEPLLISRDHEVWSLGNPVGSAEKYSPITKDEALAKLHETLVTAFG